MVGRSSRDITNQAVVSVDGRTCQGAVAGVHTRGVCKRSVLIHLDDLPGKARKVIAFVAGTRRVLRVRGDSVRVVIGGSRKVTTVRLVVRTTRGTVRLKRRFHTCVRG